MLNGSNGKNQEYADRFNNCDESILEEYHKLKRIAGMIKITKVSIFEYLQKDDRLIIYDEQLEIVKNISDFLSFLKSSRLFTKDKWKAMEFFRGNLRGPLEIRIIGEDGNVMRKSLDSVVEYDNMLSQNIMVGSIKDITKAKKEEEILKEKARRDSLTMLYNRFYGKELVDKYLNSKNPYATCGLVVIDIDYFKNVNDTYGHLFGDKVLIELADLLVMISDSKDIVMRSGGDEFVILFKDINHSILVMKVMELVKSVRKLTFEENSYSVSCSVGVCFLPENVSGYTYEQLFENADWALYLAKENGRNRYEFCDNLQRFELKKKKEIEYSGIDARYIHNDIVSTAFEIFEKMNSFDAAVKLLLRVIGIRFNLDRITIIRTNIKEKNTVRQYQWVSVEAPEVLEVPGDFTKQDFLTLFHSYDEYGTTVLHHDNMSMYSEDAVNLLMQGKAKTVVYAAMYCEGKYTGAISYVVCSDKRHWSKQNRSQLGEITKIISAHLSKKQALNASFKGVVESPEYDSLTGLLSFARFKEEAERIIVGGEATSHTMLYMDFEDFKYFNQKCGYSMGDLLLKEFTNHIIESFEELDEAYFTRVVADRFILFISFDQIETLEKRMKEINDEFVRKMAKHFSDVRLRVRTGIYHINPDCISASTAIDAANYARKQIKSNEGVSIKTYDDKLCMKQTMENEIINGMDKAMQDKQFEVYMQPKFSLKDFSVVGAEALVRWRKKDGSMLFPDSFIPLYEGNGRIIDLDFYVFEHVVKFIAKNKSLGRRQVPISVNASVLHASNDSTVNRYLEILEKYGVDPSLTDIELTETATVSDYNSVKKLFECLQNVNMMTSLDDFGAGYSILNTVIDIPVDTVKIDRGFISNCESTEKGIFFLNQMISMVKGLGFHVICEGVETKEQVEILKNAGCEEAQGYFFAKPMPIEEYEKMMYVDKPIFNLSLN